MNLVSRNLGSAWSSREAGYFVYKAEATISACGAWRFVGLRRFAVTGSVVLQESREAPV